MGRLVYFMQTTLDGFVQDENGDFEWAWPDADEHAVLNEESAGFGTFLMGRRMYEAMQVWETDPALGAAGPVEAEFAATWQRADKYVWSAVLTDVVTARTQLRSSFDPEEVRAIVAAAATDVSIEGPTLAAHALRQGLVDSVRTVVYPVAIGRGLRFLPDLRIGLRLVRTVEFGRGCVLLDYDVVR